MHSLAIASLRRMDWVIVLQYEAPVALSARGYVSTRTMLYSEKTCSQDQQTSWWMTRTPGSPHMPSSTSSLSGVTQIQCQLQRRECPPLVQCHPNDSLRGMNAITPHGCLKRAHINHVSQPHWQNHP